MTETNIPNISPALGFDAYDSDAGAEEGAVMEVIGPHGEILRWPGDDGKPGTGRPYTITFYGADSKRFKALELKQADMRDQHFFRTRQPQAAHIGEKNKLDLLVVATKEWDVPNANGEQVKNDPAEYRAAYMKHSYLRDQALVFVGIRGNFLKNGRMS